MNSKNLPLLNAKNTAVIFDGDDTLWDTMPTYTRIKNKFFVLMAREGFDATRVEEFFEQRDIQNVSRWGFARKRFQISMLETFKHFHRQAHGHTRNLDKGRIARLADSVFAQPTRRLPYAESVLRKLQPWCRLLLLTKGDRGVQKRRLASSGLEKYFRTVQIVAHKNEQSFRRLIRTQRLDASTTWSIGNSLRSDVTPALAVGMNAIWIPRATWAYEDVQSHKYNSYLLAHTLRDVPATIMRSIEQARSPR